MISEPMLTEIDMFKKYSSIYMHAMNAINCILLTDNTSILNHIRKILSRIKYNDYQCLFIS